MRTHWAALVCGLVGCALPPEPMQTGQLPEFTVLTAERPIGDVSFSVSAEGRLEGTFTLNRQLATTHPIRVSVVWLEAQYADFQQPFWSSLPLQQDQQLISSLPATPGMHAFAADLIAPPAAALRVRSAVGCMGDEEKHARATLIAFVDTNENGVLDLSTGAAVDHVLSSTNFPTVMLGDQRPMNTMGFNSCLMTEFWGGGSQPAHDDARLDLVSCLREDRFAVDEACGLANDSPAVTFVGSREDDNVLVGVSAYREVTFILDADQTGFVGTRGTEFGGQKLAVGQHHLRAERGGATVWEATFTFPDRTWVKAVRPAPEGEFDVHFQEAGGATSYIAIASRTQWGESMSSPIRLSSSPFDQGALPETIFVQARFGDLPFTSSSLQRRSQ